jgi:ABC-type dipeptide/oligopeptide/nickel transport system ATPase component
MCDGAVVEEGPVGQIFNEPKVEYTRKLLGAALDLDAVLEQRLLILSV